MWSNLKNTGACQEQGTPQQHGYRALRRNLQCFVSSQESVFCNRKWALHVAEGMRTHDMAKLTPLLT